MGALHDWRWLPHRWLSRLEDGKRGRRYIVALAQQLAKLELHDADHVVP